MAHCRNCTPASAGLGLLQGDLRFSPYPGLKPSAMVCDHFMVNDRLPPTFHLSLITDQP